MAALNESDALKILYDLLENKDILACMISRKGMQGIMPPANDLKIKDIGVWQLLNDAMNPFFDLIENFHQYNLDKVYFELADYLVIFFPLVSDVALVCIIPAFANRGLLEVEVENARRNILKLMGKSIS